MTKTPVYDRIKGCSGMYGNPDYALRIVRTMLAANPPYELGSGFSHTGDCMSRHGLHHGNVCIICKWTMVSAGCYDCRFSVEYANVIDRAIFDDFTGRTD